MQVLARRLLVVVLLVWSTGLVVLRPTVIQAQDPTGAVQGVYWTPPEDLVAVQQTLAALSRAGVEAVRTGIVEEERLLTAADSLGIMVLQDLPLDLVPAEDLEEHRARMIAVLDEALTRARRHRSARSFGLVQFLEARDPEACAYVRALAERVREAGVVGAQVYYTTPFVEQDRCAEEVDFVLLEPTGWPRQEVDSLTMWSRPIGLAHVSDERAAVTARPWSHVFYEPEAWLAPERRLLRGAPRVPETVRPAPTLVYVGQRTASAFSFVRMQDAERPSATYPLILSVWLVLFALGITYASSAAVPRMVPRYFLQHGFYQQSIQEGREMLFVPNVVLLVAQGISLGVVGACMSALLADLPAWKVLTQALPAVLETFWQQGDRWWAVVLGLGGAYVAAQLVWASILGWIGRFGLGHLDVRQTLMLVAWACWAYVPLAMAAALVLTLPASWHITAAAILAILLVLLSLVAMIRTLADLAVATRTAAPYLVLAACTSPVVVILLLALFAGLEVRPEIDYAWALVQMSIAE